MHFPPPLFVPPKEASKREEDNLNGGIPPALHSEKKTRACSSSNFLLLLLSVVTLTASQFRNYTLFGRRTWYTSAHQLQPFLLLLPVDCCCAILLSPPLLLWLLRHVPRTLRTLPYEQFLWYFSTFPPSHFLAKVFLAKINNSARRRKGQSKKCGREIKCSSDRAAHRFQ